MDKIKRFFLTVAGIITALAAGAAGAFMFILKKERRESLTDASAEKQKEDVYEKIKETPAADIMAAADNSVALESDIGRIDSEFKQRVRERVRDKFGGTVQGQ